jgi:ABC-type nitrate/sulfonate/bicarbonate transport system permease component
MTNGGAKSIGLRAGSIVLLLLLWWAASRLMNDPEVLPGPLAIVRAIATDLWSTGPEGYSPSFTSGSRWPES